MNDRKIPTEIPDNEPDALQLQLAVKVEALTQSNRDLREARKAALNMMEDAILSKENLRKSEEKYRTLFETMGQGYAECEVVRDKSGRAIDHRLITLNPAFEKQTG